MKASVLSRYAAKAISVGLVLGIATATSSGLAAADEPDLKLSLGSDSVFASGQSVTAVATIVNNTGTACRLASIAEGAVQLDIERNGRPVQPEFATISYAKGYDAARWPM
jgi:hypothetical protein